MKERFTRSLEIEAKGTGIQIVDLMPGDYKTEFNQAMDKPDINALKEAS